MTDIRDAERAGGYPMTDALDKARQDENEDIVVELKEAIENDPLIQETGYDDTFRRAIAGIDAAKQRIAELGVQLKGAEWSSKHNYDGWMQEVERGKESYQAGFLACQKQAAECMATYANGNHEDKARAQAISELKPEVQ
jgi:hypothetical protein